MNKEEIPKNIPKAIHYYKLAANNDIAQAQYNLDVVPQWKICKRFRQSNTLL